jgi:hypothetical protein
LKRTLFVVVIFGPNFSMFISSMTLFVHIFVFFFINVKKTRLRTHFIKKIFMFNYNNNVVGTNKK